jgi:hypothetical protein
MIPSNREEVDSWTHFLHARWQRYALEQKLSEKAQRKQLPAFMAGGNAILDAFLKWQKEPPPRI